MRYGLLFWITFFLAAHAVPAQRFTDPFNYAPGPLAGPWNADLGKWTATGTAGQPDPGLTPQYATLKNLTLRDGAAECLVMYNPGSVQTMQMGGLTLRAVDPGNGRDLISAIVAKQVTPPFNPFFNLVSIREYGKTGLTQGKGKGFSPEFSRGRLRLIALDLRLRAQVDTDCDGRWNHKVDMTVRNAPIQHGSVGLCASGGVLIDDFKVFDAVLIEAVTAPVPRPGVTVPLDLRAFPGAFYQAAASLGSAGFPLMEGRIPLTADPLFFASAVGAMAPIFRDFRGRLDNNGHGAIRVAIPGDPTLVGITTYIAFIAHASGKVLNFSNDHEITIRS